MTLQVAILSSDGVLLASDTCKLDTYPQWPTQAMEDEDKVVLNAEKTVAGAWSGNMPSEEFILSVIDVVGGKWGMADASVSESCFDLWKAEEQRRPSDVADCKLLIVHSKKRQVYKASFSRGKMPEVVLKGESHMRFGLSNGKEGNPACFFIYRYLPRELVPVESLVRLAAHYILMAGQVNPYGVGGLTIHLSKDGNPFEEVPEEKILQLMRESDHLDRLISGFLLTPLSAPDLPAI